MSVGNRLSVVAVIWSLAYLLWRTGATLGGADPLTAACLLFAEFVAVAVFVARAYSTAAEPIPVVAAPDAPRPDTAAVVDATGRTVDDLRITLLALRRVDGIDRVVVVDRVGSRSLKTLADRFDVRTAEPSVTLDEVVAGSGSGWVLLLRAGELPMPDLVAVCAPRCSAPDVAVVQVGIEEAAPTSFDHEADGHWSLEPFEQHVVRPSLAGRGSVPWYGDGPVLVRRAAVAQAGSSRDGSMLGDSPRMGMALIGLGMTVTHVPVVLARVPSPTGLRHSLERRGRRNAAAVRASTPARLRSLHGSPRAAHLLAFVPFFVAIQRVLLGATAVLVLAGGRVPLDAGLVALGLLAVPSYLLRWIAHIGFGRGQLRPLSILRSDLRSLPVDLVPWGSSTRGRTGLGPLVALIVVLAGALLVATASLWWDWPGRPSVSVTSITMVLTVAFVGIATEVVLDSAVRRQRRGSERVRLGLVTCRLEELDGQLIDLSTGGAGVIVEAPPESTVEVGAVTTLSFRIPDADGAWRNVSSLVHIVSRSAVADGGTRLGLAFDDPTDAPLDPVIEFLTIDRRLVALGRAEAFTDPHR